MGNEFFVEYIQQTDTTLYFLTLEKVSVSLPAKCLSDPTSGSVFIGNYKLGPAPSRHSGDHVNGNDITKRSVTNRSLPQALRFVTFICGSVRFVSVSLKGSPGRRG